MLSILAFAPPLEFLDSGCRIVAGWRDGKRRSGSAGRVAVPRAEARRGRALFVSQAGRLPGLPAGHGRALPARPVRVLSGCLMRTRGPFVLWAREDGEVTAWYASMRQADSDAT